MLVFYYGKIVSVRTRTKMAIKLDQIDLSTCPRPPPPPQIKHSQISPWIFFHKNMWIRKINVRWEGKKTNTPKMTDRSSFYYSKLVDDNDHGHRTYMMNSLSKWSHRVKRAFARFFFTLKYFSDVCIPTYLLTARTRANGGLFETHKVCFFLNVDNLAPEPICSIKCNQFKLARSCSLLLFFRLDF